MSTQNNFLIKEVESTNEFKKVYSVFRNWPYNELWPDEEIEMEFEKAKEKGKVFGYYTDGECVGIISFYDIIPNEHPIVYDKNLKVLYFSDVAVLEEHRKKGIATTLINYMLDYATINKYDKVYMRTMQPEKSMSYKIVIARGFKMLSGVTENKKMQRVNGKVEADDRIFLEYDVKGEVS